MGWGLEGVGTRELRDSGTRGRGDFGTRGLGDVGRQNVVSGTSDVGARGRDQQTTPDFSFLC